MLVWFLPLFLVFLLISVNLELILRNLVRLFDEDADLPSSDAADMLPSAD